jgi:hypothetical protein
LLNLSFTNSFKWKALVIDPNTTMQSLYLSYLACLAFLVSIVAGLFNGQPYVGSPEQHAEMDAITKAAQARRAAYAAQYWERVAKEATNITEAIQKHENTTQQTLDDAHKAVNAAISGWEDSYRPYILNPRRTPSKSNSSEARRRRRTAKFPRGTNMTVQDNAVFDAAALLAEVEAAERARSGNLYRNYTIDAPNSPLQQMKSKANANRKRNGGDPFWLEELAPSEHGTAPFAPKGYKVCCQLRAIRPRDK